MKNYWLKTRRSKIYCNDDGWFIKLDRPLLTRYGRYGDISPSKQTVKFDENDSLIIKRCGCKFKFQEAAPTSSHSYRRGKIEMR